MGERPPAVLVFAPLADDAASLAGVPEARGLPVRVCADADEFLAAAGGEPLAAIISQEGAAGLSCDALAPVLDAAPSWSALPLLFVVSDADRPPRLCRELLDRAQPATVAVLQRPVRPATLGAVLDAHVQLRRRQFETADLLRRLQEAEAYQRFLRDELEHRIRNMLSVLQATVRLSSRNHDSVESYRDALTARLFALAEAYRRLVGANSGALAIRDVLSQQIGPYCRAADQLRLDGPEVVLTGQKALDCALIVHEMATNAAKYGALSVDRGVVEVGWREEGGTLSLVWTERGGPPARAPEQTSFGTRMIDRLPRQHGGSSELAYEPQGLVWTFRLPL